MEKITFKDVAFVARKGTDGKIILVGVGIETDCAQIQDGEEHLLIFENVEVAPKHHFTGFFIQGLTPDQLLSTHGGLDYRNYSVEIKNFNL
jgi:hypothetical protein